MGGRGLTVANASATINLLQWPSYRFLLIQLVELIGFYNQFFQS